MHPFHIRWTDGDDPSIPHLGDFTFTDTLDVVDYCELDRLSLWRTYDEIWHLDDTGRFRCSSKGSSFENIRTFADDPERLLECRSIDLGYPCPNRWVIIEPRQRWTEQRQVTEADGEAYTRLVDELGLRGITLLDALLIGDEPAWWSMRELTTGSTAWPAAPLDGRPSRAA